MTDQGVGHRRSPMAIVLLAAAALGGCGGSDPGPTARTMAKGYAYIASADVLGRALPGAVFQYAIEADGSWVPQGTASVAAGAAPAGIVADPGGRFVYVVNRGDATVSQYAIGPGGALAPLSPPAVAVSGAIAGATVFPGVAVDPTGRYLYVVTRAPDPAPAAAIAQYSIGTDGALVPLEPATVAVPAFAGPLQIDPAGQLAYAVANIPASEILEFSIEPNGTLVALSPGSVAATPNPIAMTITADGQRAYILGACVDAACEGAVTEFAIGADGQLTAQAVSAITGGHVNPVALLINGASAYLLVNQMGVDTNLSAVAQYQVSSGGAFVPNGAGPVSASSGAVAAAIFGPNVYALSANAVGFASGSPPGGHVDRYTIGPGGVLTAAGTTTVAASLPVGLVLVPAR